MMTTKPKPPEAVKDILIQAHGCILDAVYIADLIEMAADNTATPHGTVISGAVRVAAEKLKEASKLLDEAESKQEAA